jgi:hypothetical protein
MNKWMEITSWALDAGLANMAAMPDHMCRCLHAHDKMLYSLLVL